jgi:hypothetical protein
VIAKGIRYILKKERIEIVDRRTPLKRRDAINKKTEFLLRTTFTIIKKAKTIKRNGTKAISESKRFTAKIEERKILRVNRINGRSKIVLRNLTEPSIIILSERMKSDIRTTAPARICLGIKKKSVVMVVTIRPKVRHKSANKRREILFK